jgi:transposase
MLTIPGVAIVTLAGFFAEVGDLGGYDHGQQIIRLAGFNLKENSSGKKKASQALQNAADLNFGPCCSGR